MVLFTFFSCRCWHIFYFSFLLYHCDLVYIDVLLLRYVSTTPMLGLIESKWLIKVVLITILLWKNKVSCLHCSSDNLLMLLILFVFLPSTCCVLPLWLQNYFLHLQPSLIHINLYCTFSLHELLAFSRTIRWPPFLSILLQVQGQHICATFNFSNAFLVFIVLVALHGCQAQRFSSVYGLSKELLIPLYSFSHMFIILDTWEVSSHLEAA